MTWVPIKHLCEGLGADAARHRLRLLNSGLRHQIVRSPGRDGKQYEMLCVWADDAEAFKTLVRSTKRYKKK